MIPSPKTNLTLRHRAKGFTLVEFVVVMLLVGILTAFAVPSFTNLVNSSRVASAVNQFIAGNSFARSEAISRKANVGLAPAQNSDWTTGWIVFVDANFNGSYDAADPNETVLARGEAFPSGMTAADNAATAGAAFVYVPGGTLRFNAGALGMRGITLALKNQTKTLCVSATGTVRQASGGSC